MEQSGRVIGRKPILRALAGEAMARPPIWLMRQAGRYLPEYRAVRKDVADFLELCFTPELAVEVTLQPIRRYGFDAAILFSDILVVPHGLGQKVAFREGEGPVLEPVRSVADLTALDPAPLRERLATVYQAVRGIAAALPPEVALIGFAGSPWTVATYMVEGGTSRDFSTIRLWAYRDPIGFEKLIDLLVVATIEHLSAQIEAGVEIVQLFDTWAGILPEAAFRRFVIAPTRRIVAGLLLRHPGVPIIGFPRGAGLLAEAYAKETGVTVIGLDAMMSLGFARDRLQVSLPVQGNLDPLLLVAGGAAMAAQAREILSTLSGGPFVFNLGHGIVPQTPPEHVQQLVDIVRDG
ncbi:MAG: hemE [Rhodospirillales bacterium]|nr:hemE [Rhodospirillales bacterium]